MNRRGLWANNDFLKLWAGESISIFGSLMGRTALPFTAILVLDAGPLEVALLSATDVLPGLLLGLIAGVWVDRLRRRPIMIAADIGRAILLATIPFAYALDALTFGHLFVVGLGVGTLTIFFDVAYLTYLPTLVGKNQILDGNSKLAASSAIAEVGGFSAAGWMVQLLSGPATVLIDAVSFLVSALFVGTIKTPEPPPVAVKDRVGMRHEIAEGARHIWHDPILRAIAGTGMIIDFSFRMFGAVFLVYVTKDLGFEPGVLGLTFAVGGISSLVGAVFAGRAGVRLGIGPAMVLGVAAMGVSMFFVPAARDASILALGLLIGQQMFGDGAFTVYEINQVSLRQSITPEHVMGRVNAGIRFLGLGAMLAGALIGGVLGELAGERVALVAAGSGVLLAALWLSFSPVRRTRTAPVPPGAALPATPDIL